MDFEMLCPNCESDKIEYIEFDITYDDAYQSCKCKKCECEFSYSGRVSINWDSRATINYLPPKKVKAEE